MTFVQLIILLVSAQLAFQAINFKTVLVNSKMLFVKPQHLQNAPVVILVMYFIKINAYLFQNWQAYTNTMLNVVLKNLQC
jgi:hypothetical protein